MISNLGDLLRAAYDTDNHTHVPLQRELEWLHRYASMMSGGFAGSSISSSKSSPASNPSPFPACCYNPSWRTRFDTASRQGTARYS